MALDSAYDARFFSEEIFARIFHASPVALSLSTLDDGRYLEVNDSFLRVIGYARNVESRSSTAGTRPAR